MALTSFSNRLPFTKEEKELANYILEKKNILHTLDKSHLKNSSMFNIGVESNSFKNFSGNFSDLIFDAFYNFAKRNLNKKLPLLISGGCGLNCDWNTKWKNSGLFSDVFVSPVTNDSGSAIGTAIDALFYYTGKAKIEWSVYSGKHFIDEKFPLENIDIFELSYEQVAKFISEGKVIAWVQNRAEIGPRALGNRSILASPFEKEMQQKINIIKRRENYRPVAPICLQEDVSEYFHWSGDSPYMLYFQKLKSDKLKAITHVDNTARVQTVNYAQNKEIYNLLVAFKKITGFSVLCNTSLNFNGMGFINRTTDLVEYSRKKQSGWICNK